MAGFFAEYERWMGNPESPGWSLLVGATVGLPLLIAALHYASGGLSGTEALLLSTVAAVIAYLTPIAGFELCRN